MRYYADCDSSWVKLYIMNQAHHFLFDLFQTSGSLDFKLNGSLLPCLYALLTRSDNLSNTLIWFESRFPFYNTNFVYSNVHYCYHIFRRRFLNFKRHNERYQENFFNNFLGRGHCHNTCDLCTEHGSIYYENIDQKLFRVSTSSSPDANTLSPTFDQDFDLDDVIYRFFKIPSNYHYCTSSCHSSNTDHFYSLTYKELYAFAYFQNLLPLEQCHYIQCHTNHNTLYEKACIIILHKLKHVYGTYHLETIVLPSLSVRQLKMVIDGIIPIGLDLDIPHLIQTYQL